MTEYLGQTLTCHITGKQFVGEIQGSSTNYAIDGEGNIYSDEGVDIDQKQQLLDRSKPFQAYISSNGKHLTGWKGNILGLVLHSTKVKLTRWSHIHGAHINHYTIQDVHGGLWYGRSSPGVAIILRAYK